MCHTPPSFTAICRCDDAAFAQDGERAVAGSRGRRTARRTGDSGPCTRLLQFCAAAERVIQVLFKSRLFQFSENSRSIRVETGQKPLVWTNRGFKPCCYVANQCGKQGRGETGQAHAISPANGILADGDSGVPSEWRVAVNVEDQHQPRRGHLGGERRGLRHEAVLRPPVRCLRGGIAGGGGARAASASRRQDALRISERARWAERYRNGHRNRRRQDDPDSADEAVAAYADAGRPRSHVARSAAPPGSAPRRTGVENRRRTGRRLCQRSHRHSLPPPQHRQNEPAQRAT